MKIFASNFTKANFKNRKCFFLPSVADSYKATIYWYYYFGE